MMKLKYKGIEMIIAEDSPNALLIKKGHDFIINDDGKLIIGEIGEEKTIYQLQNALNNAESIVDIKRIIGNMLKLIEG